MATKRVYYECRFCKRLYDEETQANECEGHHEALTGLTVIDGIDSDEAADGCFPRKILLKHENQDGLLAEYALCRTGDVAEFYQTEAQWFQV